MKQQGRRLSLIAGANFKRLIKEAHMSQQEAADRLGYSEDSCIRRLIRNGITKIDMLEEIANIFNVPITELIKPLD